MAKQFIEETQSIEEVTPYFLFNQADDIEECHAFIYVATDEYLTQTGEPDEDISPYQFDEVFVGVVEDEDDFVDKWKFRCSDQFIFHEVCYGTWMVAELKYGEYDIGGSVNQQDLESLLISSGFTVNDELLQYF